MPYSYSKDQCTKICKRLPKASQLAVEELEGYDAADEEILPMLGMFLDWRDTMKFDLEPQFLDAQDLADMSNAALCTIKTQESVQALLLAFTSRALRFQDWVESSGGLQKTPHYRATDRLPDELLLHIFEFVVGCASGIDFQMRKTLMLCCKDWESLVQGNALMWTHISVRHPSDCQRFGTEEWSAYWHMMTERSGTLPLILDVNLQATLAYRSMLQQDYDFLASLCDLIPRAIDMVLVIRQQFLPLPSPSPLIKRLGAQVTDVDFNNSPLLFTPADDVVLMPPLRPASLSLDARYAKSCLRFAAIDLSRVVHFGLKTEYANASHLQDVLMTLDSVQHMLLDSGSGRSSTSTSDSPGSTQHVKFPFPHLKSLSLEGEMALDLGKRFQMPALRALQLIDPEHRDRYFGDEGWETLVHTSLSDCPLLQALTLVCSHLPIHTVPLHKASCLRSLSLHASVNTHLDTLKAAASAIATSSITNLHIDSYPHCPVPEEKTQTLLKLLRQVSNGKKDVQVCIHTQDICDFPLDHSGLQYLSHLATNIERFRTMRTGGLWSRTVEDLCAWAGQMAEEAGESQLA